MNSPFEWIYLASQSPRRRELLTQIGVAHRVLLPGDSQQAEALEAVRGRESPATYVQRVTRLKLDAAIALVRARGLPSAPVLCADTTVALGRRILGKPEDATHAQAMLETLSGQSHRVLTALALGVPNATGWQVLTALSVSRVQFADLRADQIADYVHSQEPMGKAGAYAVQGAAGAFVVHIRGSYSGIVGLPLFETAQLLRQAAALGRDDCA
ncbi:MAG: Maf family protein [Rhodoferax sp.]